MGRRELISDRTRAVRRPVVYDEQAEALVPEDARRE
jgi:hypothetical protein